MAIKYGGSGVYKNLLYLLSTDALLDEDNQNTGIDLLRRIFGAFYYYGTLADSDQVVIAHRTNQKAKWEETRQIFWSIAQHMLLNDQQLPFDVDQFFPQIKTGENAEDPNRIVSIENY